MTSLEDPELGSQTTAPISATQTGPRHRRSRSVLWNPSSVALGVIVIVAVGIGVFVRFWILGNQPINGDEATPGLMAHQIIRGHPSAFYWGQDYGSGEPYVVALLFAVAGQSPFTLNLTPALLAVAAAIVVWRIGLRLFTWQAAIVAAVLTWIWGEAVVWNSVREIGFRGVTLLCGLLVVLISLRIHESLIDGRRGRLDWIALGLVAGLGWWASPEISYFLVPSAVFIALDLRSHRHRRDLADVSLGLTAFVIGALPWIVATLRGADTFHQQPSPEGYLSRLQLLFTHAAPIALGVRVEGAGNWLWSPSFGVAILVLMAAATVGACVALARDPAVRILIVFLCAFPFLYAAFSATYFWNDARYVVYLTPVLSLLWIGALWRVAGRAAQLCAAFVLVAALLSTLASFNDGYGALNSISTLTRWTANPNQAVTALGARLEADHVQSALADYWAANPLTFITDGKVLAIDPASTRNPPATTGVMHDAERTWVFVNPAKSGIAANALGVPGALSPNGLTLAQVESWAQAHNVSIKTSSVGPFIVVSFDRSVSTAEVAAGTLGRSALS